MDPRCDGAWDSLIASHPAANIFHTSAWARVLADTYQHKPFYLQFLAEGATAAMLPLMEVASLVTGRRGVSLPFSDFCSPLVFGNYEESSFLAGLSKLGRERKWKYFELRERASPIPGIVRPASKFFGHSLDLQGGSAELLNGFASSVRRNIHKAEGSGLTVSVASTREALFEYYRLHARTRRRHGAPPQSKTFFSNICINLLKRGYGFVVLAKKCERLLAGAVFLTFGRNAIYKFGASDERFLHLRANNLVMWEGIRFLSEAGSTILHFGRTSPDNVGLRRFKLGWGANEETINYSRFDLARGAWVKAEANPSGAATKLFKKLPLSVNKFIGRLVYPHLD